MDYFYDGWIRFLELQKGFIYSHYKAWKSQAIFLNNSDCVWLKEESHIPLG